jgi:hypothetical protein
MNANSTIRKQHDLFVASRNRFSARWSTSPQPDRGPSGSAHEPGDGISNRERREGNFGSAAADGAIPDDDQVDDRIDDATRRNGRSDTGNSRLPDDRSSAHD